MLHSQNKVAKVPTGPASNQNQKLPPQYDAQFKQVIKFYEARNYKKALKSIESILKDHPQHGETLSLKGLVISSLEAHERLLLRNEKSPTEYAKLGLSRNLHSYLCWQVFGLIHRSERNYKEAVKCYRQASRLDPENLQVLRDLATLQTQVRDHSGLLEIRNAMLALKPSIKLHWIGLAVAHYLNQNYEVAYHVLEAFEKATAVTESPIQISELQLFKIQSLMRAGEYLAALDCVQRVRSKVLDTTVLLTLQAECELKLSKKTEAAATFVKLLQLSGENVEAVRGYVVARMACPIPSTMTPPLPRNATPDQRAEILDILEDLDQNILHGASSLVQREALDFCTPVQLPARLRRFALPYLLKSIPSLYSALKSLYRRTELWTCIESVLLEWYEAFHASGRLPEMKTNNPVTLLWLLILLSHHGLRTGNLKQAWIYWEEARAHSPTMEHIYALKAKMLKHQGQHGAAADAMNEAREMDLADRYLTNRTVKYLIRADRLDEAAALYATFSRAKEGEVLSNAIDFQTLWFELEVAESYYRQGDVHSALRLFLVAEAHFQEFYEDQVDFHGYCLRKYTLRAYMDLLEFHNHSAQDATYRRATTGALICYLRILDEMCKRVQRNDSTAAVDVTVQEILASRRVATSAILGEITTKTMTGKSHGAVHPAETMDEARREVARLARVLEQYDLPESMRPLSEVNSMDDLPSCTACERPPTASSVGMDKHQSVHCIRTCILLTRAHVHNQSVLYATRYLAIAARTIHEHRRLFPSASNGWESPDCTQQHVLDCIQGIEQCLETLPRCEETKEVTEMIAHAVRNTLCNDTLRAMKAISR